MRMTHDEMVSRLICKRDARQFTLQEAAECLTKAIAGNFAFGFEVMDSFLTLRHLKRHQYEGTKRVCSICQLPGDAVVALSPPGSDGEMPYDVYKTGGPGKLIAVWDHVVALTVPKPTDRERAYLRELITIIAQSRKDDTIHDLRITLSNAGILSAKNPQQDDYARFWNITNALVNLGIMPNDLLTPLYNGPQDPDQFVGAYTQIAKEPVILPASAWRGRNGINRQRCEEVFALAL